ncbi:MAG: hypothetical protein APR63_01255 [Desulfuromonas sp. SDB]|nr:MAG: hypothetical protein APR63_01255 [Desulfuromonas sp. SDB]
MSEQQFHQRIFGKSYPPREIDISLVNQLFNPSVLLEKSVKCREIPIEDILITLDKTGQVLGDPQGYYYQQCLSLMPALINYSPKMVKKGLQILKLLLSRDFLITRLNCLGNYHALDYFAPIPYGRYQRTMPIGTICHIAAGNVFLGSVDSLIYGMITKNVNILKASRQDLIFPTLFFQALEEVDQKNNIIPYVSLVYWSRDQQQVTDYIKKNVDAILLFGGEQAVKEYKQNLSPQTEFISFGPKISFAVITEELDNQQLNQAAKGLAMDVVIWEQRACTSCQNIFIEDRGQTEIFAGYLDQYLAELSDQYPQNNLDINDQVEIRKERELADWQKFQGEGDVLTTEGKQYTVIVDSSNDLKDSPLNRTVFINKVDKYQDVLQGNIQLMKYYMSTVCICSETKEMEITENFMARGVMRFCKPGTMSLGKDGSTPHDGVYIPTQLVRLINLEDLPPQKYSTTYIASEEKQKILLSRVNAQLLNSQKCEFYRELFKESKINLDNLEQFKTLPVTEKDHLVKYGPPSSAKMLTDKPERAYIFSAGGTTGSLKYVYYRADEFARSELYWGEGFKAAGITPGDRTANYLKAGAFWTAFPATNQGLEQTGCTILSLTANQTEGETLGYLKRFQPTAIFGVSTNLILLAETAREQKIDVHIEKLYYTGEHLASGARDFLKDTFHAGFIRSLGYAAVEVGPIGFQCEHCRENEFHVFEFYNYVELDSQGDILVTTLDRFLHPLIRYRIGDRAELIAQPCSCGRTSVKIKLLARDTDMIKLNFAHIYLKDLFEIADQYKQLSFQFQVIVEPEDTFIKIKVVFETIDHQIDLQDKQLIENIEKSILDKSKEIKQNWEKLKISQFSVELVAPGSIKRVSRTGKIRRIIDRRSF